MSGGVRGRRSLPRLHVLTDEVRQRRWSHEQLAALALRGGADAVQLREKRPLAAADRLAQARRVRQAMDCCGRRGALIVDDRVEVAVACAADGVHLGREDARPGDARRLLGERCWIGFTVNDPAGCRGVDDAVDYLGVGPVFGTRSKAAPAPRLGLERLRRVVRETSLPVIAIGGIDASNVDAVLATGVHGVAVLSAVILARDPEAAMAEIAERLRAHAAHAARTG